MTVAVAPPPTRPALSAVVPLLALVEFASGVLQGGFPILLPRLGEHLGLRASDLSLALGVEFLVSGVAVPLTSRLGDLYGHRRLLRATVLLTLLGFAVTALAPDLPVLLAGRALSGFLACWLPLEFAILRDRLGEERGGRAVGPLVGALTVGSTLGAIAVGALGADPAATRPLLWALAVLPVLALPVVWRLVPESATRAAGRIDWAGTALLSLGLTLLLSALGASGALPAAAVLPLLGAGALLLALFVRQELRSAEPMVDVRLLARRATAPVFGLSFLLGCALYGAQGPTLAFEAADPATTGYGLAAVPLLLGLLVLPQTAAATLGALTAHRLTRRHDASAVLAAGFALCAAGYGAIALGHAAAWQFVLGGALAGYGAGLGLSLLPALLMRRLPADQTGIGTGVYNTLKSLAGAAAGVLAAAVLDHLLLHPGTPAEGAYTLIWAGCAAACGLGVPVALALRAARGSGGRPLLDR
ncbi:MULTISPECIES: MFS transporter [Kitasatospora]|uniref:Putative major facilitator superfamily transporter n=1 Tax=Kitasatospora setae (strain ATCC 33774 / DSM 43861 / JCM 3304 / KCC A-0304 / NBRC 14216 / KM-6054) TaxID=452652 RepID=E4NEK3_KITSK|nr:MULTISPECIES: MFS transporter [Kitasatospora]BAJ29789.1 putative major facilitator superfamily transporter [Kitasatospora setae KM-6054]